MKRIEPLGLGLLRTLLACSVLISHCATFFGYNVLDGLPAVQTFFMISGFYMAMILTEKYADIKLFYTNRLLRLYPVYWTVLAMTIVCGVVAHLLQRPGGVPPFEMILHHGRDLSWPVRAFVALINVLILGQDTVNFVGIAANGSVMWFNSVVQLPAIDLTSFLLVPQAWTLSLELMFYALAPWLIKRRTRWLVTLAAVLLVIRIVAMEHGYRAGAWSYRFFPFEMLFFVTGMVCYRLLRRYCIRITPEAAAGISLFLIALTFGWQAVPLSYAAKKWLYYLVFACCLPFVFEHSKRSALDRAIGDLSYSVYLVHALIIVLVGLVFGQAFFARAEQGHYLAAIVLPITLFVAFLLQLMVQGPIDRYRAARAKGSKSTLVESAEVRYTF